MYRLYLIFKARKPLEPITDHEIGVAEGKLKLSGDEMALYLQQRESGGSTNLLSEVFERQTANAAVSVLAQLVRSK